MHADAYEVDGLVVPRIEAGRLAVAFESATGAFAGLRVELAGIPTIVVDQLVGAVQGPLAGTLAQASATQLVPMIDDFLVGASVRVLGDARSGEVALDQIADGIDTAVSVTALAVTGGVDYQLLCIDGSSTFSVTAGAYRSTCVLVLGVDGAAVTAGFETTTRPAAPARHRSRDLPGPRRRRAPDLRARHRAAARPALSPVLRVPWIVLPLADSAFPIGGFAHSGGATTTSASCGVSSHCSGPFLIPSPQYGASVQSGSQVP